MKKIRYISVILFICLLYLPFGLCTQAEDITVQKNDVTIELGSLRVTNKIIELRCQIINNTDQDIWICKDDDYSEEKVFLDEDFQTLLILRRNYMPYYKYAHGNFLGVYYRFPAGHSRPEVIYTKLPILQWHDFSKNFMPANSKGIEIVNRLAFEIGYYTKNTLDSLSKNIDQSKGISFDESKEKVIIHGLSFSTFAQSERAVRLTVDNVSIPYDELLVRNQDKIKVPFQYLIKVPLNLTQLNLSEDKIRAQNDFMYSNYNQLTILQKLEDLFYNFSLSLEEYQYSLKLLSFDKELLQGDAKKIADVFIQMANGDIEPAELNEHLDKILNIDGRKILIQNLQEKQNEINLKNQERVEFLIREAKNYDNIKEGRKALASLRELLTIEPTNEQALSLMRKISSYYKGQVITNAIGMELIWIPAGEFMMGCRKILIPEYPVRINRGFWMGVHEVTHAQYKAIMGKNPNWLFKVDEKAVNDVSWINAAEFCRLLSKKEGKVYRLPTEPEWEYACRAGTNTDFWWGDEYKQSTEANPFGLYGMHGNVGEWCERSWSAYDYYSNPELDAQEPRTNDNKSGLRAFHIVHEPFFSRRFESLEYSDIYVGFRVVLEEN